MFDKILRRFFTILMTLIVAAQFILAPGIKAQSIESINGEIGSGGSSTTFDESGNSGTTLLVLAGVAVAALLIYKFVFYKDKNPVIEDASDSTSTNSQSILQKKVFQFGEKNYSEANKLKDEMPINLYVNLNRNKFLRSDSRVSVGLSYRF
jgi:hypothetical protein